MAKELKSKRAKEPPKGLTLLEILISIAILAVLSAAGVAYLRNVIQGVNLNATSKNIVSVLRDARSRAIAGQSGMKWGVNFVNSSTPNTYYYELFSTPTTYSSVSTTIDSTYYLPGTISFGSPGANATTTMIFAKIVGTTATSSVTIVFENTTSTITVTPLGNVHL